MVESFKGLKPFKMISLAFGVNGMGLGILFGKKTIFFLSSVCFQFKDLYVFCNVNKVADYSSTKT